MLRITTTYRLAETGAYILRVTGKLEDNWVQELRRSWRPLQNAVSGVPIRVDLADVECVDAAGKVLLAEMRGSGVEIFAGRRLRVPIDEAPTIPGRGTRVAAAEQHGGASVMG